MNKILQIALGILTSIGGFLDVGAIATSAEAGSAFGFQLLWALLLGTVCVIFLVEMAGRIAAVSKHTLIDAIREHFGFRFQFILLCAELVIDFLILASEIGGISIALQLITGISFQWWAIPVAFAIWLILWRGTLNWIENGVAFLGLVSLVFVITTFKLHPSLTQLGAGLLPTWPHQDTVHYLYIAVSILGAVLSPYLFYFYSSGAREDEWDEGYLWVNRGVAIVGMSFGSVIAMCVLIVAALVLKPRGIPVDSYQQAAQMLSQPLGYLGLVLFAATLGITCLGASLEICLNTSYLVAQVFGWNWGQNLPPKKAARFNLVYTMFVFPASLLVAIGIDPLKLTLFSAALTTVILPLEIFPFIVLMNDERYVGKYGNSWVSNSVVIFTTTLAFILAIVVIPLELLGGG